jgi:hypothetical protein
MMYGIVIALALGTVVMVLMLVREVRLRRALELFVRLVFRKENR